MTTTKTTATYTIIESRRGVHTGTVARTTLRSAEMQARKDIRLGYADSAAIWVGNEQIATFGSGR